MLEFGWRFSNSEMAKEIWRFPIHPFGHMVSDMSSSGTAIGPSGEALAVMLDMLFVLSPLVAV